MKLEWITIEDSKGKECLEARLSFCEMYFRIYRETKKSFCNYIVVSNDKTWKSIFFCKKFIFLTIAKEYCQQYCDKLEEAVETKRREFH